MEDKSGSAPEGDSAPSPPSREQPPGERVLLLAAARLTRQLSIILNNRQPMLDAVQTIRGEDAVAECFASLRSSCKLDLRLCGRALFDEDERIRSAPFGLPPGAVKDLRIRGIYDTASVREKGVRIRAQDFRVDHQEVRLFDGIPFPMVLFDFSAAMVAIGEDAESAGTALLIRPSQPLNIIDSVYDSLWRLAAPLPSSRVEEAEAHSGLAGEDLRILEMLADGATDQRLATVLGVSVRTVQRKITELLSRLGAETRFQAGINATKRGWI
ncbi:helix-turn-helix transcriptional regulator [Lentzea sp. HUAS12]|uniref:helix-turn-helix transcriptional regulator n=1 Tax=Lentzea sp. HUAS12 TaxID=2951806 RepID=UPI0020A03B9A|nr:helix-turn-helix transcriptional regulator [Lentzea sp. HUAS12]USX56274.1 helix-turn-helix transcriptional regulator [Lentzea sp. HUAS12]